MSFAFDAATTARLAALPWNTTRKDRRQVTRLLAHVDLDPTTELGAALEAMLQARVSECRDFFALRGVRARPLTVMQMAGRSLAADRDQIARLETITPGFGQALLRALSRMIERWATTGELSAA